MVSTTFDLNSIPKENADCVLIGAGVVGIAVVRDLALRGRHVLVLESCPNFGAGGSSRNSQVIHAGVYHPPNSLKALLCKRGRELMYDYCDERRVPVKRIGKLIVATEDSEIPKLEELLIRGTRNGVQGLKMMDASEAMEMEPELRCVKALFSPLTGIVDGHSLMLSWYGFRSRSRCSIFCFAENVLGGLIKKGDAENHGATFSYNQTVIGGHIEDGSLHLHVTRSDIIETRNENETETLRPELILIPKIVVNSAGLAAVPLARRFIGLKPRSIPPVKYVHGCYFTLPDTKPPFRHLIYPVPEEGGLGVHLTLDLKGNVRFGPDVEWIEDVEDGSCFLSEYTSSTRLVRFDYSVPLDRAKHFYSEIRKYYRKLEDGSLEPGYSGIRPKLSGPGQSPADFVIQGEDVHGVVGLVNLFGIDSPGLTSCMAIAERATSMLVI